MYKKLIPLVLATTVLAAPAGMRAQASPDRRGGGSAPNFELYGGYSYVFRTYNPTSNTVATTGRNGWDASFKVPVFGSFLGVKGDVVGSAHVSQNAIPDLRSDNTFAVAVGAGLDFGLGRNLAWRVTGDYFNTHYQATDQNLREILNSNGRISPAPVLRF